MQDPNVDVSVPLSFRGRKDVTDVVIDWSNWLQNFQGKQKHKIAFLQRVIHQMCPGATVHSVYSACNDEKSPKFPKEWSSPKRFEREQGQPEPLIVDATVANLLLKASLSQRTVLLVTGDGNADPILLCQIRGMVETVVEISRTNLIILGGRGRVNSFYTRHPSRQVNVLFVQNCVAAASGGGPAMGGGCRGIW